MTLRAKDKQVFVSEVSMVKSSSSKIQQWLLEIIGKVSTATQRNKYNFKSYTT